jgi:hypothetical protein
VSFDRTAFSGGAVYFDGAAFSGGTVDLSAPATWNVPPTFDTWPDGPPAGLRLPSGWPLPPGEPADDAEPASGT